MRNPAISDRALWMLPPPCSQGTSCGPRATEARQLWDSAMMLARHQGAPVFAVPDHCVSAFHAAAAPPLYTNGNEKAISLTRFGDMLRETPPLLMGLSGRSWSPGSRSLRTFYDNLLGSLRHLPNYITLDVNMQPTIHYSFYHTHHERQSDIAAFQLRLVIPAFSKGPDSLFLVSVSWNTCND